MIGEGFQKSQLEFAQSTRGLIQALMIGFIDAKSVALRPIQTLSRSLAQRNICCTDSSPVSKGPSREIHELILEICMQFDSNIYKYTNIYIE